MTAKELLTKILFKRAKGYRYTEKTDEYVADNGEKRLVKSKTVTKRMPPDVSAIKVLIALGDDGIDVTKMTDEELASEKTRLLRLLSEMEDTSEKD